MFEEGNIIYFDPFYFKNGNTAKPKYLVVLKNVGEINILASLPTRKNNIPLGKSIEAGCLQLPEINLDCFAFSTFQVITECGKYFDFPTFIYGHQIDDYEVAILNEIYPNEGTDFVIWGKMKSDLFSQLINCFKSSKSVKRKYKRYL
jgi:hypothetical protein